MYNVMIVDDEPVIRFGLKASVAWDEEGLHFIGDYPNGEEAWKAMEQHHVDILITDIKMPIMDGLTLMKHALQKFPKLKVVLVSSYNDFEYVRAGLQQGAVDYVLKPTLEPEQFTNLIRTCKSKLEDEQKLETKLDLADRTARLQQRKALEDYVKYRILHEPSTLQADQLPPWLQEKILVVCVKTQRIHHMEDQYGFLYKTFLLEEVQNHLYERCSESISVIVSENELLVMTKAPAQPADLIATWKKSIEPTVKWTFTFGYHIVNDLLDIADGFAKSEAACEQYFFHSQSSIFSYKDTTQTDVAHMQLDSIDFHGRPYNHDKAIAFIEERQRIWKTEQLTAEAIKQEACDIVMALFQNQLDYSNIITRCTELQRSETLTDLLDALSEKLEECRQELGKRHMESYPEKHVIDHALQYIHQFYTGDLTLQKVADHVHVSRNYFSIMFKKSMNQTFIDYVIDLRINKAKDLLENTSLKVYEVAESAGFNDVKYFSKLFKRMTGYSPMDYRAAMKNDETSS
ncbi:response regulator [Bacillus sp. HMF5848]|uniref:response regulator transcription factor n=1 Tax=Bacillus sp. HMF5848 TaxID=2495421 RepID=UPI000F7A4097|nr:response regulator [Bacillus sp. HMF5848]RSK28898.1 response regulator [Bacillus sp. HMF5848]